MAAITLLLSSSFVFAEDVKPVELDAEKLITNSCELLSDAILLEFDIALNKKTKGFDAFTALQQADLFWQRYETLDCLKENPEHLQKAVLFLAKKNGVEMEIVEGQTPSDTMMCNALLQSFNNSFEDGANPDHGITPDGDAVLNMESSRIIESMYSQISCITVHGKDKLTLHMLQIYHDSKLKAKAREEAKKAEENDSIFGFGSD
jgi:hypothetical protein